MFSNNASNAQTSNPRPKTITYSAKPDAGADQKPRRDFKKLFLVIGLGALSWVATYVGMLELIEANMGELPLVHKVIIGFSVAMLMTMIIWLLDQMFAPNNFLMKLLYSSGYAFLTLISIGFSFGFYWKVLESKSEATRGAESAITQVQGSLHAASTRLDQLQSTLVQLTAISTQKAEIERTQGTSCPNSKPGDGPRRKLRDEDAQRFTFASDFVKGRAGQVKTEMATLDTDLIKIVKDDKSIIDPKTGTRNDFLRSVGRKLDLTVTGFNAFRTDPQLKQIRADLAERGEKTTFTDTRGGTYACPDPQLQTALRGVVRAIDGLPELQKPHVSAVEGSEATVEAFRRLTATFIGALSFKLPPSAEDLRDLQKKAVQSVESAAPVARGASFEQAGLSRRDYIPLSIALFVDLCLLLVSIGRPTSRMHGLVPKMRAAENGPVSEILTRFNDIHKDPQIRESFEIFRHVIFDFNGDYYAAVPLDAPKTKTAMVPVKDKTGAVRHAERRVAIRNEDRHDLQMDAHQLANLFTSFEKERIFARVLMPVLTTRAIQKKLARQGSKFAEAEAFRIYKFKNGAWQEMILGAIMGAAKRVETQNAELAESRAHELPLPRPAIVEPRRPANDEAPLTAPPMFADNVTALPRKMQAGYNPAYEPRPSAPLRQEPAFERQSASAFANPAARAPEAAAMHAFQHAPNNDATMEREFYYPATTVTPDPIEPTVATAPTPAFNPLPMSFATALRASAPGPQCAPQFAPEADPQVERLYPLANGEPTVEIEARRESVTYRMPLRDAPLAQQLQAAAAEHASLANDARVLDVPSLPPQALPQSPAPANAATHHLDVDAGRAPVLARSASSTGDNDIDFRRIAGKFGLNSTRN